MSEQSRRYVSHKLSHDSHMTAVSHKLSHDSHMTAMFLINSVVQSHIHIVKYHSFTYSMYNRLFLCIICIHVHFQESNIILISAQ